MFDDLALEDTIDSQIKIQSRYQKKYPQMEKVKNVGNKVHIKNGHAILS